MRRWRLIHSIHKMIMKCFHNMIAVICYTQMQRNLYQKMPQMQKGYDFRKSRTGFILKLNNSPIYMLSKKQSGIEISLFRSKSLATKHSFEYFRGVTYKIRMTGIYVKGPAYIFSDKKSVLSNSSVSDSVLQKKSLK